MTSPNYPEHYDGGLDCRWLIAAPVQNIITLKVLDFETYDGSHVGSKENLVIYDGTNMHGQSLKTLSGTASSDLIISTGSNVYLRFTTIIGIPYSFRGFKLEIENLGKYIFHVMALERPATDRNK